MHGNNSAMETTPSYTGTTLGINDGDDDDLCSHTRKTERV